MYAGTLAKPASQSQLVCFNFRASLQPHGFGSTASVLEQLLQVRCGLRNQVAKDRPCKKPVPTICSMEVPSTHSYPNLLGAPFFQSAKSPRGESRSFRVESGASAKSKAYHSSVAVKELT